MSYILCIVFFSYVWNPEIWLDSMLVHTSWWWRCWVGYAPGSALNDEFHCISSGFIQVDVKIIRSSYCIFSLLFLKPGVIRAWGFQSHLAYGLAWPLSIRCTLTESWIDGQIRMISFTYFSVVVLLSFHSMHFMSTYISINERERAKNGLLIIKTLTEVA